MRKQGLFVHVYAHYLQYTCNFRNYIVPLVCEVIKTKIIGHEKSLIK